MVKRYTIKRYALMVCLLTLNFTVLAQNIVSGTIKDKDGKPLPGASIKAKGATQVQAISNNLGEYTINIAPTVTALLFNYVGYYDQEVRLNGRKFINVVLQENATGLDEVIVTGYTTTTRRDLTGSVGTVNMKDIEKAPVRSFEEALAGRVAGVSVTSESGEPGSNINIVIRGTGSISQSNRPLFVIDGFPMESLDNDLIDPNEIATIDILKDASATALYGARGSNGVIVITTKRGTAGAPVISYNSYYGINKPVKYLKLLTPYQFVQAQTELGSITGNGNPYLTNGKTLDDYRNVKGVDFQDQLLRTAGQMNHSISVAGGSGGTRYSFSGNYFNQQGIIINSSYTRYQGKLTLDQELNKKIKIGGNLTYTNSLIKGSSPQSTGGQNSVFNRVFTYRPISVSGQDSLLLEELYDPDITDPNVLGTYLSNPILNQQNAIRNSIDANIYTNIYIDFKITPHLKFTSRGSASTTFRRNESFNGSKTASGGAYSSLGVNGSIYNYRYDNYGNSNILTYTNSFNKTHYITAVAGAEVQYSKSSALGYRAGNIPDESLGLSGLDAGEILIPTTDAISYNSMASFIGSASYNYKGKYYFTGNFRADGSSKFVNDNKWGYFPSGAVKWKFSKEDYFKKSKWLSDGNIRFSYGTTGNNRVGDFDTYARISFTDALTINGVIQPLSAVISSLQNPSLRWEKTVSADLGIDLAFLKNRFKLTLDFYNRDTKDLLYRTPLPYSTGFTSAIKNVASINNKGLEITLEANVFRGKNFDFSTSINTSLNRNRLTSLSDPTESAILSTVVWEALYGSIPSFIAKVGGPLGQMYGLISNGLYQYGDFDALPNGTYVLKPNIPGSIFSSGSIAQPGDNKFVDVNNDGIINDDDKVVIGNGYPLLYGGWSNNLSYKNFDINLFFQWSYGNDVINANRIWFANGLGIATRYPTMPAQNAFADFANRWTPEHPNTDIPKMLRASPVVASQFVEDGSFIRLKTINIGYTIPNALLTKIKIKKIRVYLSAQNLFTLTNYKGYDPELSAFQTALTPSVDYSTYPRPFTITTGLNITL